MSDIPIENETPLVLDGVSCHFRPHELDAQLWDFRRTNPDHITIARVCLRRMYECSCIGVAFNLYTHEGYQRRGLARSLMLALHAHAKSQSMNHILVTIRVSNLPSIKLFESLGYQRKQEWQNSFTGNFLYLYSKILS